MWIVFIAILIVVGLIALHLNISNYRDNNKKVKPTPKHSEYNMENIHYMDQHNKEQNERILKMFENRGAV
jgi:lipopolysaccharide export system protein LptC